MLNIDGNRCPPSSQCRPARPIGDRGRRGLQSLSSIIRSLDFITYTLWMRQSSLNRIRVLFSAVVCLYWVAGADSSGRPHLPFLRSRLSVADIAVLQHTACALKITMSTSPDPGPVNGHASHFADEHTARSEDGTGSPGALSDAHPAENGAVSPDSTDAAGSPDRGAEFGHEEHEESSESSDNDGAEDGDFEGARSPASLQSLDLSDHEPSSTRPAAKRKAAHAIEDEYMRENPELYGLRRSVRGYFPTRLRNPSLFTAANHPMRQSRPTQRRKIVSFADALLVGEAMLTFLVQVDSDDEEEPSESDETPAPRKTAKRRRLERSLPGMSTSCSDSTTALFG